MMGKISETWFTLRALSPSADGQSLSIVPEPSDATPTGISCSFATLARFCSFQFNKILFSLLLLGLIAALVALAEVDADLKSKIAKNSLTSSQLRHVLKADEASFTTFEAKLNLEGPDLDKRLREFSVQLEELRLESTAMKMALQFLTKQLNATKEQSAATFQLMLKEANLTLCTEEKGGRVTVPAAGVYRLQFSATVRGAVFLGEKVFSLQQNGVEFAGGAVLSKARAQTFERRLLIKLQAGDSLSAVLTAKVGFIFYLLLITTKLSCR